MIRIIATLGVLAGVALPAAIGSLAQAAHFSPWGAPMNAEAPPGTSSELNTTALDGCPIQSPDGFSLYMASNRPGSDNLDIWVAHRASADDPFGAPEKLPEPVNSSSRDFCPTPLPGGRLFFVSDRPGEGTCGGSDIYLTRLHPTLGWLQPAHLGCHATGGPSAPGDEMSPSYFEHPGGASLYFSSPRSGNHDIYVSELQEDGTFGAAEPVAELNSGSNDFRPNVRKDGREVVFDSNRAGTQACPDGTTVCTDIWTATRDRVEDPWSTPVNLGAVVNTTFNESRASFSRNGETLYFGSNRPAEFGGGPSDIYFTTREKVNTD